MALGQAFNNVRGDEHPIAMFRAAAADLVAPAEDSSVILARDIAAKTVQVTADSTGQDAANVMGGLRAASGAAASIAMQAENDAKTKKDAEEQMFQALLASLQAQIDALGDEIEAYNEQIDAIDELLNILKSGEEIDPNDPRHRKLLQKAGVPDEQWGIVDADDLNALRGEAVDGRSQAQHRRDQLEQDVNDLTQAHDNLQAHIAAGTDTPQLRADFIAEVESKGVKSASILGKNVDRQTQVEILSASSKADEQLTAAAVKSEMSAFS